MSLLSDILKEVPLSIVLREKISALETELSVLKDEKATLKDDLRQAGARIAKLEKLAHNPDLDADDVEILKRIAMARIPDPPVGEIARGFHLSAVVVQHRLRRLVDLDYLSAWSIGQGDRYALQPKSREFCIKNNLLN